jgi:hypothetical protein
LSRPCCPTGVIQKIGPIQIFEISFPPGFFYLLDYKCKFSFFCLARYLLRKKQMPFEGGARKQEEESEGMGGAISSPREWEDLNRDRDQIQEGK